MTAEKQDFSMTQGDTKKLTVSETDDDDDGGTLDVSDRERLEWKLTEHENSDDTLVSKTESDSVRVMDVENGGYEIVVNPEDTEDLKDLDYRRSKEFYHEVELEMTNGGMYTLMKGAATIDASP